MCPWLINYFLPKKFGHGSHAPMPNININLTKMLNTLNLTFHPRNPNNDYTKFSSSSLRIKVSGCYQFGPIFESPHLKISILLLLKEKSLTSPIFKTICYSILLAN
jgi:hypothetical protein